MTFQTWDIDEIRTAPSAAVVAHMADLQRHRNQLDAYEAIVLNEAGGAKVAAGSGEHDVVAALVKTQGVTRTEAARRRRTAKAMQADPASGRALNDGNITADQLHTLASADVPCDERDRLRSAAIEQSTQQTQTAVRRAEQAHRRETADERQQRLRGLRTARRYTDRDGLRRFEFSLDPDTAAPIDATLTSMVDRLFREDRGRSTSDARRQDQRLADAFAALLAGGATGAGSGSDGSVADGVGAVSVVLNVTVGHEWLVQQCDVAGVTDEGTEVSPGELRRMACDAAIVPIVMGGPSEVLDVGRSRRVATTAQRRALVARDAGCVYPGCDAPPAQCHAHHVRHWCHFGATDLDNLALVCHRHHSYLHAAGMALQRGPAGWYTEPLCRGPGSRG